MLNRVILLFIVGVLLVGLAFPVESVDRVMPCQKSLAKSIKLANDWTCPFGGPSLDSVDIVLDCQHHAILGPGSGFGITVSADRASIKDCDVSGFQVGVVMKGLSRATLQDSRIKGNEVGLLVERVRDARVQSTEFVENTGAGIYSKGSFLTSLQNSFAANGRDVIEVDPLQSPPRIVLPSPVSVSSIEEALPDVDSAPVLPSFSAPGVHVFENKVSEAMISLLGIDSQRYFDVEQYVDVSKAVRSDRDGLVFSVVISAKEPIDNLVLYELFPQSLADSPLDISSPVLHEVAVYDPVVMKFFIGSLSRGEEFQVAYRVASEDIVGVESLPQDAYTSSILMSEAPLEWQPAWWVEGLFVVFLLIFAFWIFEEITRSAKRIVVDFILCLAIILLFLSYDLDLIVIVNRTVHQWIVAVVLFASSMFYGLQSYLLTSKSFL